MKPIQTPLYQAANSNIMSSKLLNSKPMIKLYPNSQNSTQKSRTQPPNKTVTQILKYNAAMKQLHNLDNKSIQSKVTNELL